MRKYTCKVCGQEHDHYGSRGKVRTICPDCQKKAMAEKRRQKTMESDDHGYEIPPSL